MSVITRPESAPSPESAPRLQPAESLPLAELRVDAPTRSPRPCTSLPQPLAWAALVVAAALALSPLFSGYFNFSAWGPLALGAMALLIVLALIARPAFTRQGLIAGGGLILLLALSAASMLWAESKDSAWTAVNRLALYAVIFAIVALAVRDRRPARAVLLVLGSAALVTSIVLCVAFLTGGGQGAFLERRLNAPIGYINGTAGLLIMGIWPWLALAETARRRLVSAGAVASAAAIGATAILTQSRAIIPALILSAVLVVLCAPARRRRLVNLGLVVAAMAASLPWTLAVYSSGGSAARLLTPGHGALRSAGAAILLAAVGAGVARLALDSLAKHVDLLRFDRAERRLAPLAAGLAVVALVGGAVAAAPWISHQYRTFTSLRVNQSASVRFTDVGGYRYDTWRVAVNEFRAHPLGGLGAGNYDTAYYQQRRSPVYVVQPHSLELQTAAELGIGGIAALVLFCAGVFWAGFTRRGTLAAGDRLVRVGALGMFTAWLVGTSVDWLYDIPGLAGMALVAAALLVVPAPRPETGTRVAARRWRIPAIAAVFVLVAVLSASVGRQYVASRYASNGAGQITSSPAAAIRTLRTAAALDPYSMTTLYSLAAAYARLNDYRHARAALAIAERREPHNYVPPALLGDLAMRRGAFRSAAAEYRRALALNPRDPGLRADELDATGAAR